MLKLIFSFLQMMNFQKVDIKICIFIIYSQFLIWVTTYWWLLQLSSNSSIVAFIHKIYLKIFFLYRGLIDLRILNEILLQLWNNQKYEPILMFGTEKNKIQTIHLY